jgi:hypothetical protein
VIGDASVLVKPTIGALGGARPSASPIDHGPQYDWDASAEQAAAASATINGIW